MFYLSSLQCDIESDGDKVREFSFSMGYKILERREMVANIQMFNIFYYLFNGTQNIEGGSIQALSLYY